LPGANSPNSPKIRRTLSEGRASHPSLRFTRDKLTTPVHSSGHADGCGERDVVRLQYGFA
jgi:hypothetical protein